MSQRTRDRCVPTSVLRDILRQEYPRNLLGYLGEIEVPWEDVAMVVGVDEKQIRRIVNLETTWTAFNTADTILTRLHLMHLWYMHPGLVEVYEYLDALPSPQARQNENRRARNQARKADIAARLATLKEKHVR